MRYKVGWLCDNTEVPTGTIVHVFLIEGDEGYVARRGIAGGCGALRRLGVLPVDGESGEGVGVHEEVLGRRRLRREL